MIIMTGEKAVVSNLKNLGKNRIDNNITKTANRQANLEKNRLISNKLDLASSDLLKISCNKSKPSQQTGQHSISKIFSSYISISSFSRSSNKSGFIEGIRCKKVSERRLIN